MLEQALAHAAQADLFIAAAAVADYAPETIAEQKIKKDGRDELTVRLVKNPDVVAQVARIAERPFVVGFAAETENLLDNARAKLARKQLDVVIANDVSTPGIGFNSDHNAVWMIDADRAVEYPAEGKLPLARRLVEDLAERLKRHNSKIS